MRILVLARHFPPEVSGGARRWTCLSEALVRSGHEVTVVAPDLGSPTDAFDAQFPAHIMRIPHGPAARGVVRKRIDGDLAHKSSIRNKARAHLLVPDPDIRWAWSSADILRKQNIGAFDWVVTSSPPESMHAIGFALKGTVAKYWHADIRDYWLRYPLMSERRIPLRRWLERRVAKRWLSRADLLTAVDAGMADEAAQLSGKPGAAKILPNFAVPLPSNSEPAQFAGQTDDIKLVYTGTFSLSDPSRTMDAFLAAFEAASIEEPRLSFHHIGQLSDEETARFKASPASPKIHLYGSIKHEKALAFQHAADALVLTAGPNALAMPGKFEEYQATGRRIIVIGRGPWRSLLPGPEQDKDAILQTVRGELDGPAASVPSPDDTALKLEAYYRDISGEP